MHIYLVQCSDRHFYTDQDKWLNAQILFIHLYKTLIFYTYVQCKIRLCIPERRHICHQRRCHQTCRPLDRSPGNHLRLNFEFLIIIYVQTMGVMYLALNVVYRKLPFVHHHRDTCLVERICLNRKVSNTQLWKSSFHDTLSFLF